MIQLKPKQREDLARAALHDGLILAWQTGLGKSIGSYFWSLLKLGTIPSLNDSTTPKGAVLIVGPPDGFDHWQHEGRLLGIDLRPLDSQAAFRKLSPDGLRLPSGFYYTSYTQLGVNGVEQFPAAAHPKDYSLNVGDYKEGIKCVWSPSLADLVATVFDCVIVDEAVHMKGADSLIGMGVRQLDPPYRLVCTATPIKNRLPDLFFLICWAARAMTEPNARCPYRATTKDQQQFAETFLISEHNLTQERNARLDGKRRRFKRLTPQVCNVHGLWKLLAPNILRRTKADMQSDIPPKHRHVIRVPLGKAQAETYRYHLHGRYVTEEGKPNPGGKLQALRIAAAHPGSLLLKQVGGAPGFRSANAYTPKLSAALNLILRLLREHEQFILFGSFQSALDVVARRLNEAGVSHLVLDGRIKPSDRGRLARQFKNGDVAGICAGLESMAEMHSFPECHNAILTCYSWAYDKFEQAINRIHRINSSAPVHVWSLICDGTIDRRLEEQILEKSDAADLVVDGRLIAEVQQEESMSDLVAIAQREFHAGTETIDEEALEREWPDLRVKLREAMSNWRTTGAWADEELAPPANAEPSLHERLMLGL